MGFGRDRLGLSAMSCETASTRVRGRFRPELVRSWRPGRVAPLLLLLFLLFSLAAAIPLAGRTKDKVAYGEGLIVNIPLPEPEVLQVVEDVAANGLIRGTKEYNKDEFVAGAKAADSSRVFPAWEQGGKVFYKVRMQAIDPRNFKDSNDMGTLVVRYVVQPQGEKNTVLRIDALFEEDFRHVVHQSDGSVENAEYKDIREHLEGIEGMKNQNVEALKEREEQLARKAAMQKDAAPSPVNPSPANPWPGQPAPQVEEEGQSSSQRVVVSPSAESATPAQERMGQSMPGQSMPSQNLPGQSLEDRVKSLRQQVERLVKAPGAPLKSAPFHTASTLVLLSAGTEVLIVISSPYWYGVETHEGQHGWMQRDQLEPLP
jgi:hypothetical protein